MFGKFTKARVMKTSLLAVLAPLVLWLLASGCTPTPACGPDSCFGCCTTEGECVGGQTDATCGLNGALCATCLPGSSCESRPGQTSCVAAGGGGGGGGGGDGGSGDAGFIPSSGVALAVLSAEQVSELGRVSAATGHALIPVSLRIGNGEPQSISLAAQLFTVRTAAGLDYSGSSWVTENMEQGCPSNALLAPDSEIRCGIGFELPRTEDAQALLYPLPDGGTKQVPLTVPPCDECGGRCVDLETDENNCGSCGHTVGDCNQGVERCPLGQMWCTDRCIDDSGAETCSTTAANCNTVCGKFSCSYGVATYEKNGCVEEIQTDCGQTPQATFTGPCGSLPFTYIECHCF